MEKRGWREEEDEAELSTGGGEDSREAVSGGSQWEVHAEVEQLIWTQPSSGISSSLDS